jgi:hypothetical protein
LSAGDRAVLLARLASHGEDVGVLADAAAVLREMEEAGAATAPAPRRRAPWRAPSWGARGHWVGLAAAAVVVIAIAPWLWSRRDAADERDPGRFVTLLARPSVPVDDGSIWPAPSRGAPVALSHEASSVLLGARLADLALAVRAGDSSAPAHARAIASLLDGMGSGIVAQRYRVLSDSLRLASPAVAPILARLGTQAARSAGERAAILVELGAWLETARAGVRSRDADFFRGESSGRLLDRAVAEPSLSAQSRAALARTEALLSSPGGPAWESLDRALRDAMTSVAQPGR